MCNKIYMFFGIDTNNDTDNAIVFKIIIALNM